MIRQQPRLTRTANLFPDTTLFRSDFLELGELMCKDALDRAESCGGHFREESQTEDGEALRDDENFSFVSAWEWTGDPATSIRHEEPLVFENVALDRKSTRLNSSH